jgi:BA14K-like protein
MRVLLVIQASWTCFAILTSGGGTVRAQITGTVTPDPAAAESSEKQDIPAPGGCMPIGITVSGDVVFPLQCKDFIERQKALKPKPATAEEKPATTPQAAVAIPENVQPAIKPVEKAPSPKRVAQEPPDRPKSRPACTKYQSYDRVSETFINYEGQRRPCR